MTAVTNRAPGRTWALRPHGTYPQGFVDTTDDDRIHVTYFGPDGARWITLSRKGARLLAKRINACLDATVIR